MRDSEVGPLDKRCKLCAKVKSRSEFRFNDRGYPVPYCKECEVGLSAKRKQEARESKAIDLVLQLIAGNPVLVKVLRKQLNLSDTEVPAQSNQSGPATNYDWNAYRARLELEGEKG
jgi:hypothetical protein